MGVMLSLNVELLGRIFTETVLIKKIKNNQISIVYMWQLYWPIVFRARKKNKENKKKNRP